jgi:hypothetical protein
VVLQEIQHPQIEDFEVAMRHQGIHVTIGGPKCQQTGCSADIYRRLCLRDSRFTIPLVHPSI